MSFSLRQLTLDDMDRAAVVLRTSFDERLPWLMGLHTPQEDRAYFRGHVISACEVWGAVDGAIIGIVAFRPGWVDQLYVLPDFQGRGVGTALLQKAQALSASLLLWTFQRNTLARRFYEANGFFVVDQTDGGTNEECEPDVLYRWDRPPSPAVLGE
jgi:GNAT superfamily N-acetyltransferase